MGRRACCNTRALHAEFPIDSRVSRRSFTRRDQRRGRRAWRPWRKYPIRFRRRESVLSELIQPIYLGPIRCSASGVQRSAAPYYTTGVLFHLKAVVLRVVGVQPRGRISLVAVSEEILSDVVFLMISPWLRS